MVGSDGRTDAMQVPYDTGTDHRVSKKRSRLERKPVFRHVKFCEANCRFGGRNWMVVRYR